MLVFRVMYLDDTLEHFVVEEISTELSERCGNAILQMNTFPFI